jgi:hypothetical protein
MGRTKSTKKTEAPSVQALKPFVNEETQGFLQKLDRLLAPDDPKLRMHAGMIYGEQTKYVRWTIPDDYPSIELLQVTDVQFGHVACKYERVIEYRDWVLSKPNRYMLWTGDNVDAHALWSPGRAWDNFADPQTQVYKFVETWAPARHRILGYVGGNHERRAIPGFGDLGILIATLLRVPYSGGRQVIDLTYGKHQPFKISLWHGIGGARTKGTVAQILHRFMGIGDSQLYLMGHVHQGLVLPIWKEYRDGNQIKFQKVMGGVGTSFLESWNTYAEVAGYTGSDVMMNCAVLERDGRWVLTLR